jgi:hypothetical protein
MNKSMATFLILGALIGAGAHSIGLNISDVFERQSVVSDAVQNERLHAYNRCVLRYIDTFGETMDNVQYDAALFCHHLKEGK